MKVLVVADSFKGSYSSSEMNQLIRESLKNKFLEWDISSEEISDGGEGWLSVLQKNVNIEFCLTDTFDPIGRFIQGFWLWDSIHKTAYIEMAVVSGLTLLKTDERNPWKTSTYGTGVLIKEALDKGAKKIVLGIGGTATNDLGAGILEALGVSFLDGNNAMVNDVVPEKFHTIKHIQCKVKFPHTIFLLATDVINPLFGENGATIVFAPQKGAEEKDLVPLEKALVSMISKYQLIQPNLDVSLSGMGAGGGVAAGIATLFPFTFTTGFDIVAQISDLENKIKETDIVITGEGRTDASSLLGKAPVRIARLAKKYNKKTLLISGSVDTKLYPELYSLFDIIIPLQKSGETIEETIKNTPARVTEYIQTISFQ
ncbi:MAG: glycerate kinase [Cytophagaceae bacterium]